LGRIIGIIATLDTKGDEALFLKEQIKNKGCDTVVIDPGVMGKPYFKADITREEVAETGGKNLKQLIDAAREGASRGNSTAVMSKGLAAIVKNLYASGNLDGVIALGGGTGAILGTTAMKELPIGVPKLQVCTHPSRQHFGIKDIMIMQSVVDLVGINSVIKRLLTNAASAVVAMVEIGEEVKIGAKPTVGITCWGVVTPAAMSIVSSLEKKGYEPVLVHEVTAPLEDMIEKRLINSVVDLCAQELVALHLHPTLEICRFSGEETPREDRLESAGRKGLPWILTPGTLDGVFFPLDNPLFKGRKKTEHSPGHYLVRTSKEEMKKLGEVIAEKANEAKGPVAVAIPLRGFSANNKEGLALYDLEADAAFTKAVEANVQKHVKILKVNSHINDKKFTEKVVDLLDKMFEGKHAPKL